MFSCSCKALVWLRGEMDEMKQQVQLEDKNSVYSISLIRKSTVLTEPPEGLSLCLWIPQAMPDLLICLYLPACWAQDLPFLNSFRWLERLFSVIKYHNQCLWLNKEFIWVCGSRGVFHNGGGMDSITGRLEITFSSKCRTQRRNWRL